MQEIPARGQGRERWWQVTPEPLWIPPEGLSPEAQAEASGLRPVVLGFLVYPEPAPRDAPSTTGEAGQDH